MAKLTFLGTGLMGAGFAEGAQARGHEVTVWNRTPSKAKALAGKGIRASDSVREAVRGAEQVHLMLTDDEAVDGVLGEAAELLQGPLVLDHSTVSPQGTAARAQELMAAGVKFLHAPVFMTPQMCREGKGLMLVAGPQALFASAKETLAGMTGTLEYLGERSDLAACNKLFGNAMLFAITGGLSDVYAMAKALGVAPADAQALFGKWNPAGVITYRGTAMAKGDYAPTFELSMARKDARLMVEAAQGAPLAVLPALVARMGQLIDQGHAGDDLGVLAIDAVPKAKG